MSYAEQDKVVAIREKEKCLSILNAEMTSVTVAKNDNFHNYMKTVCYKVSQQKTMEKGVVGCT